VDAQINARWHVGAAWVRIDASWRSGPDLWRDASVSSRTWRAMEQRALMQALANHLSSGRN